MAGATPPLSRPPLHAVDAFGASEIQSPLLDTLIVVASAGAPYVFARTYLQRWLFKDYEMKRQWVLVSRGGCAP